MRGKQLTKYMKALEMLAQPDGATIKELGEGLEMDRRSVYRLLDNMEELGVPIYDEPQPFAKEKRWKMAERCAKRLRTVSAPPIQLSLAEVVALYLLKCEASIYKGTEITFHLVGPKPFIWSCQELSLDRIPGLRMDSRW